MSKEETMKPKAIADRIPVYCAFTELMDTDVLVPNPRNPNKHPKKQIEALAKIIKNQGWRAPITVSNQSGFVVRGHGRLLAAKKLGVKQVPVDRQDYDNQAAEYADLIADNQIAELAEMDVDVVKDLIQDIDTGDFDLELTGFSEKEIEDMMTAINMDPEEKNEDDIPEAPEEPMTRLGDLWLLGGHRLLCGDSTDPENVRRLMNGDLASMVFTDPPYGVSYEARSGKFEMIQNDDKTDDDLVRKLLVPAFKGMVAATIEDAAFYIWHASSTREDFVFAMTAAGLLEKQYLIWAKPQIVLGHSDYRWAHEPCFYASKAGHSPAFYGDRAQPTIWRAATHRTADVTTVIGPGILLLDGNGGRLYIAAKEPKGKKMRKIRLGETQNIFLQPDDQQGDLWEVARDTGKAQHPTQKPVELARRAIENSSRPGEIVLDLFMGSGTTLMGAEVTGRRGYGMELDPQYCDVIVRRWEEYTGQKAVKE